MKGQVLEAVPGSAPGRRFARAWAVLLLLLALPVWELVRALAGVSPLLMPPLSEIGAALLSGLADGSLVLQTALSLGYILGGALLAGSLAVGVSLVVPEDSVADHVLRMLISLLHPLPGVVLLPIIILWLGTGPAAILAIIIHSIFWPLLANIQGGFRSLPRSWRQTAANYGMTVRRSALLVHLPGSAPWLVAGLRIAWARAWRAFITAELLFGAAAGMGGLGWYIHNQRAFMDSPGLYAGILVIMATGSLVENSLFRLLEQATIKRWGMSQ